MKYFQSILTLVYWFALTKHSSLVIADVYDDHFEVFEKEISAVAQPLSSVNGSSADILWDFRFGLEGWAKATSNEMNAFVTNEDSLMMIRLYEDSREKAFISSPPIHFQTGERQAFVIRYKYVGSGIFGKLVLSGISDTGNITELQLNFPIEGDGLWHKGYVKLYLVEGGDFENDKNLFPGILERITIHPTISFKDGNKTQRGEVFEVDWIRLVRGPIIHSVTGCAGGVMYSTEKNFTSFELAVTMMSMPVTHLLMQYISSWKSLNLEYSIFKFARSFNCLRNGGEVLTITGVNFGTMIPPNVFIGNRRCSDLKHDKDWPQSKLTCITPAMDFIEKAQVRIENGFLSRLVDSVPYFYYAVEPPPPVNVSITNIAARSLDISWASGGSLWQQTTVTGFLISWMPYHLCDAVTWQFSMVVGNITTTTIRNLMPHTKYIFSLQAITEDQSEIGTVELDRYGRRDLLEGGLISDFSVNVTASTISYDIHFPSFNANLTLDYGAIDKRSSIGASGSHGEGHYGLSFAGDSTIENCNATSVCCDDLDEKGLCQSNTYACIPSFDIESFANSDNFRLRNGMILVENLGEGELSFHHGISRCGPGLRVAGSSRNQAGASWYRRQLDVVEGFETRFTFEISNPSDRCNNMNDVYSWCRSRGADGIAFVIQNYGLGVVGDVGNNVGYNIPNSIAIEFDTYYNFELKEPYENHISVQTRGSYDGFSNNSSHLFSLGSTSDIPDLTDGKINVKIIYRPAFNLDDMNKPTFVATPHLIRNQSWIEGLYLGMMYIYVSKSITHDDWMNDDEPVLIIPINISNILKVNDGRKAWVGFTAATGVDTWQTHDIHRWDFTSLRLDHLSSHIIPSNK